MKASAIRTLEFLREARLMNRGLSTLELRQAGVNHPGGRVMELRTQFEIDSIRCHDRDQTGAGRWVSRYFYIGQRHEAD